MADALISPPVGALMWTVSAATIAVCAKRVKAEGDDRVIPLMGVLGAFIFTAQMINFCVPGTGSSGHLGGGLLLAILLGPSAAFLVIASVLTIQAIFFADGGLLALGCNLFNLGFLPVFVAYPLVYRPLVAAGGRDWIAPILAAVVGLQLGAFSVVLETLASGISSLRFGTFALLMQPIHLAIGLIEGIATAALVRFVSIARPEILGGNIASIAGNPAAIGMGPGSRSSIQMRFSLRPVLVAFLVAALALGGILSWFASDHPDGLEWAFSKSSRGVSISNAQPEISDAQGAVHRRVAQIQEKTAILPEYGASEGSQREIQWKTSLSGILGGFLTLVACGVLGCVVKGWRGGEKILRIWD